MLKYSNFTKIIVGIILAGTLPFVIVQSMSLEANKPTTHRTAIVLGAGVQNDIPTLVLQTRLNSAIELFKKDKIDKIIVSGDNSTKFHNEPKAMKKYLVDSGIPAGIITEDFGGRRTMDSCYRIKNFFKVDEAIIITQKFHLGRAKLLCESVGIRSELVVAPNTRYDVTIWGYLREIPASIIAFRDVYYFEPQVGSDGKEVK